MPYAQHCLDLRELVTIGELPQVHAQATAVAALLDAPALQGCRRAYIGSSFCSQALLGSRALNEATIELCRKRGLRVTLSLPIPSQRWLERMQSEALELLDLGAGVIDEVVANDLGTLLWTCDLAANRPNRADRAAANNGDELPLGVVIGRLLNKDQRDPRDPNQPWIPYEPNLLQQGLDGTSYLDRLLSTCSSWDESEGTYRCPVCGIELDPTHEQLLLHDLPPHLTATIDGPTCYMSTGQICEFASLGLDDEQLFRPNAPCAHQCESAAIRYTGTSGIEFAKLGRTVYFMPNWECEPQGVDAYRQLVSPLWEVRR